MGFVVFWELMFVHLIFSFRYIIKTVYQFKSKEPPRHLVNKSFSSFAVSKIDRYWILTLIYSNTKEEEE